MYFFPNIWRISFKAIIDTEMKEYTLYYNQLELELELPI